MTIMNELDQREKRILEATISSYIETGEPVGSKTLSKDKRFDVSAATIRNELAKLETGGYLSQVHTSSGRIPTDKGYRLYVDSLMKLQQPNTEQKREIALLMSSISNNLNSTFHQLSALMSQLVDYTTIVVTPSVYQESLKVAHLIMVDLDRILVVLLNSAGVNQEILLELDHTLNQDTLNELSRILTKKLDGKTLSNIDDSLFVDLVAELPHYQDILVKLTEEIRRLRQVNQDRNVLTSGMSNLLKLPEFQNIELTQNVISTLEENKAMLHLFDHFSNNTQTDVIIGEEHQTLELKSCSMVVAPFKVADQSAGMVGVLGPKRMAYPVIVPMVSHISEMITNYCKETKKGVDA